MSEHIGELLSLYIDEEISGDEKCLVEKHLSNCPDCQNELYELSFLKNQLTAEYQFLDIPDLIEDQIMAKISQRSAVNTSRIFNRNALLVMITFSLLFIVMTGPFLTMGLHIFHTLISIGSGLVYAIPSILSAIPYVIEVVSIILFVLIILAVIALRFVVKTMGNTVRTGDL